VKTLHLDYLGQLNEQDKVENSIVRLKNSWKVYQGQANKTQYALLKAVIDAFQCKLCLIMLIDLGEYLSIVFINFLCTGLNLVSPYLISQIIEFIETKDDKKNPPKIESGL